MEGFERGNHERRIVVKLDSLSLMSRLGRPAQGMALAVRRTMQNGRTLNIVRTMVVRSGKILRRMRSYVTMARKSPLAARKGYSRRCRKADGVVMELYTCELYACRGPERLAILRHQTLNGRLVFPAMISTAV